MGLFLAYLTRDREPRKASRSLIYHMVIRAKLLTEITHSVPVIPIFLRCFCCSIAQLSRDREAYLQQSCAVEGAGLRGAQLASFISASVQPPAPFLPPKSDDKKDASPTPNPEYDPWIAKDQQVLNYLLSSLSREILSQI